MPKVKHTVFLKFRDTTTPEQIEQVFNDLLDLSEAVEGIEDYVAGPNISPQGLSQGYTHGFIMTFADAAARDAYLPHPEHKAFEEKALPLIESVAVVDFEV
jgi:quinol monooxygenase YgiN